MLRRPADGFEVPKDPNEPSEPVILLPNTFFDGSVFSLFPSCFSSSFFELSAESVGRGASGVVSFPDFATGSGGNGASGIGGDLGVSGVGLLSGDGSSGDGGSEDCGSGDGGSGDGGSGDGGSGARDGLLSFFGAAPGAPNDEVGLKPAVEVPNAPNSPCLGAAGSSAGRAGGGLAGGDSEGELSISSSLPTGEDTLGLSASISASEDWVFKAPPKEVPNEPSTDDGWLSDAVSIELDLSA